MKANCRRRTNYLIQTGQIVRKPCERHPNAADCTGAVVPHHRDYSNPFDVEWLCSGAHVAHHAEERRQQKGLPFESAPTNVGAVA